MIEMEGVCEGTFSFPGGFGEELQLPIFFVLLFLAVFWADGPLAHMGTSANNTHKNSRTSAFPSSSFFFLHQMSIGNH